jgi:hypothetical protein
VTFFSAVACGENTVLGVCLDGLSRCFFQSRRVTNKAFIRGSAGTKLTLNQDFKHGKEDCVIQKTLMLVFTELKLLNEANLVV